MQEEREVLLTSSLNHTLCRSLLYIIPSTYPSRVITERYRALFSLSSCPSLRYITFWKH